MTRTILAERWIQLIALLIAVGLWVAPVAAADPLPWAGDWEPNGVLIASTPGDDRSYKAAGDASGGIFVQWVAFSEQAVPELRLTHVLANGTPDPRWPAGGLVLGVGDSAELLEDGAGGVYVLRVIGGEQTAVRYAQDGSLAADWLPGSPLSVGTRYGANAVSDEGELWHIEWPSSPGYLTAMRLRRDGTFVSEWAPPGRPLEYLGYNTSLVAIGRTGGVSILSRESPCQNCFYEFHVRYREVEEDGGLTTEQLGYGHEFGAWFQLTKDAAGRRFTGYGRWADGAYVQQPSSPRTWPQIAVAVDGSFFNDFQSLVPDDQGGVYVKWSHHDQGTTYRFGHVRSNGLLDDRWPLPESTFTPWPGQSQIAELYPDGAGGLFVQRWLEPGGGTQGVLQRVREDGSMHPGWPGGGAAFRQGPGSASAISATRHGSQGLFLIWRDTRTGHSDLYAQRVSNALPVATQVEMARGEFVGGAVSLQWRLADAGTSTYVVQRSLDGIEWSEIGEAQPAPAPRTWKFEDRAPVSGRTQRYRLQESSSREVLGELGVWVPEGGPLAARFRMGSSGAAAEVVLTGVRPGDLRAELRDVQGRMVHARTVSGDGSGSLTLRWGARDGLAAGVYWLQVRQEEQRASVRLIVLD